MIFFFTVRHRRRLLPSSPNNDVFDTDVRVLKQSSPIPAAGHQTRVRHSSPELTRRTRNSSPTTQKSAGRHSVTSIQSSSCTTNRAACGWETVQLTEASDCQSLAANKKQRAARSLSRSANSARQPLPGYSEKRTGTNCRIKSPPTAIKSPPTAHRSSSQPRNRSLP